MQGENLAGDQKVAVMEELRKFLNDRMPYNWKGYEGYDMGEGEAGRSGNKKDVAKEEL